MAINTRTYIGSKCYLIWVVNIVLSRVLEVVLGGRVGAVVDQHRVQLPGSRVARCVVQRNSSIL